MNLVVIISNDLDKKVKKLYIPDNAIANCRTKVKSQCECNQYELSLRLIYEEVVYQLET